MATVGWLLLQWVGALYVDRVVARGSALYGALGAVFGLLAFLHMAAYLLLVSASSRKCSGRSGTGARGPRPVLNDEVAWTRRHIGDREGSDPRVTTSRTAPSNGSRRAPCDFADRRADHRSDDDVARIVHAHVHP